MPVARGPGGTATGGGTSAAAHTITNPGWAAGAGLILVISWGGSATISSVTGGLTLVTGTNLAQSTLAQCAVYAKAAATGSEGNITVTMSATNSFAFSIMRDYTGHDPAGFTANGAGSGAANATTLTWAAITGVRQGGVVCFGGQATSRTISAVPTNYTDQYTTNPRYTHFFDRVNVPGGSEATFNRTLDNGSGGHVLGRLNLLPDPASVTGQGGMLLTGIG